MEGKDAFRESTRDWLSVWKSIELEVLTVRDGKIARLEYYPDHEGAVALGTAGRAASLVQLKSETDFVAKSPDFTALVQAAADAVAKDGEGAHAGLQERLDELKISLKENIDFGRVRRIDPA